MFRTPFFKIMPTFRAIEAIKGGYGRIQPGETFEVDEYQARRLEHLERRGVIERVESIPPPTHAVNSPIASLKALVGYENKMMAPPENKRRARATR